MCGDAKYYARLWKKQAAERQEHEKEAEKRIADLTKTKSISNLVLATMGY